MVQDKEAQETKIFNLKRCAKTGVISTREYLILTNELVSPLTHTQKYMHTNLLIKMLG